MQPSVSSESTETIITNSSPEAPPDKPPVAPNAAAPSDSGDDGYEDDNYSSDLMNIDPKFARQLNRTVATLDTIQRIAGRNAPAPSRMQVAIEDGVGNVVADVITKAFKGGIVNQTPAETGIMALAIPALNTQFGLGLGQGLANVAPVLVEKLASLFGAKKAEDMIDGAISGLRGEGRERSADDYDDGRKRLVESSTPPSDTSEIGKTRDAFLSLKPDDPKHVAAFAETLGGVSHDVAKQMLIMQQNDFYKQKSGGAPASQAVGAPSNILAAGTSPPEEMVKILNKQLEPFGAVLGQIVDKMDGLNKTVFQLQDELNTLKKEKGIPSDDRVDRIITDAAGGDPWLSSAYRENGNIPSNVQKVQKTVEKPAAAPEQWNDNDPFYESQNTSPRIEDASKRTNIKDKFVEEEVISERVRDTNVSNNEDINEEDSDAADAADAVEDDKKKEDLIAEEKDQNQDQTLSGDQTLSNDEIKTKEKIKPKYRFKKLVEKEDEKLGSDDIL